MSDNNAPKTQEGLPPAKWFAHINDTQIYAPHRSVRVSVLKTQASLTDSDALVRDHNSPNDVVLEDDQTVDLGEGNVFYTINKCDLVPRGHCPDAAKLAFSVDDRVEITTKPDQTGNGLRDLFDVSACRDLIRDRETPHDEVVENDQRVLFSEGPMFVTREVKEMKIIVNGREKTVGGKTLSYAEAVQLAFGSVDAQSICTVTYKKGPPSNPAGSMVAGDSVNLKCGMIFNVTSTRQS